MKKTQINEVRQLQKIAGIIKEDQNKNIKVGDDVSCSYEGEPMEFGTVIDVANNWDEALKKGGDNFEEWESLFNDKEYADDMGYDSFEEWQNDFVSRQKNGIWYKVDTEQYNRPLEGWFPEEYVDKN